MPYCHRCRAQVELGTSTCPTCGAALRTQPQGVAATRSLTAPGPAPLDKGALLGGARWEMVRALDDARSRTIYLGIERTAAPCRGCRAVSPADALFCEQCGASLLAAKAVLLVQANGGDLERERALLQSGFQHPGLVRLRAVENAVSAASTGGTGGTGGAGVEPNAAAPARACAIYDPVYPGLAGDGLPAVQPLPARAPLPVADAVTLLGNVAAALDALEQRGLRAVGLQPQHVLADGNQAALFCADRIMPCAGLPAADAAAAQPAAALARLLAAVLPANAPAWAHRLWQDAQAGRFAGDATALLTAARDALAAPPDPIQLLAAQRSNVGRVRDHNEDSLAVLHLDQVHDSAVTALRLYAVADGMGGHAAGEVASKLAIAAVVQGIQEQLQSALLSATALPSIDLTRVLREATARAAREVSEQARRRRSDMGTTLVAAFVNPAARRLHAVNVGDSRLYVLADRKLRQVTRDHSLAQLLIERQGMDPVTAHRQPGSNQIFRTLGGPPNVEIDTFEETLNPGDRFLLCSDGLNSMISDEVIKRALQLAATPDAACENLVRLANEAGGDDNITVIVGFVVTS